MRLYKATFDWRNMHSRYDTVLACKESQIPFSIDPEK